MEYGPGLKLVLRWRYHASRIILTIILGGVAGDGSAGVRLGEQSQFSGLGNCGRNQF